MSHPEKPSLEKEAQRLFLRASRELPPEVEARLQQARRQALAAPHSGARRAQVRRRLWWPAGALAVSCAMLLLWQPTGTRPIGPASTAASPASVHQETDGELPPDPGQSDPNMYQDLAFYSWLAAADHQTPGKP